MEAKFFSVFFWFFTFKVFFLVFAIFCSIGCARTQEGAHSFFFPGRCCQGKVKGTATFIIGEDIGPLFPRAAGALARGQANFGAARVPILNWLTSTEEVFCSKC